MSEDLIIKQTGDVLEITLNQPEHGNAMSDPMIIELSEIIEKEHENVRLFVLRGAGEDFCVGRSSMGRARPNSPEAYDVRAMADHVFKCYGLLRRSVAPVLAVVQGAPQDSAMRSRRQPTSPLPRTRHGSRSPNSITTSCRPWSCRR